MFPTRFVHWDWLVGSSFQVWIGDAPEERTNPELDLKLAISNTYSAHHFIDQAEKNLINGSSTTLDATINFSRNQTYERETSKPRFDLKVAKQKEDSKRLKRYIMKLFKLKLLFLETRVLLLNFLFSLLSLGFFLPCV